VRVLAWHLPLDTEPEQPSEEPEADGMQETEPVPEPAVTAARPYEPPSSTGPSSPTVESVPDEPDRAGSEEPPAAAVDEAPRENPLRRNYRRLRQEYEKLRDSRTFYVLRQEKLRRKVLRCLGGSARLLPRVVAFDRFRLAVRASADDPSTLGVVSGAVTGVSHALATRTSPLQAISFEPVFDRETLEARGEFVVHTSVARLAAPAVRMLVTFPYFTALIVGFRVWRMGRRTGAASASEG
jgi:hypothetical protein